MKLKLNHIQVLELYDALSQRISTLNPSAKSLHPLNDVYSRLRQYIISSMSKGTEEPAQIDNTAINIELHKKWSAAQNEKLKQEVVRAFEQPVTNVVKSNASLSDILNDDDDELMNEHYPKRPPIPRMPSPKMSPGKFYRKNHKR